MKGMLVLIGLNFEIIILVGGAIWGGLELNHRFPQSFDWLLVTVLFAVAASIHSIFRAWKIIRKG
jgi:hypothetical protein